MIEWIEGPASGVAISCGAIPGDDIAPGFAEALELVARGKRDPFNPVAVAFDKHTPNLREIVRHHALVTEMSMILGTIDVGLYSERLLAKNSETGEAVFLHQDCVYHQGLLDKWSAFVALSPSDFDNGGLIVYPGTSRYGSLGDAGEIDRKMLDAVGARPYCPSLAPGDVLFMHSATWHESGPYRTGPDRLLLDVIFQPLDDPFFREVLGGQARAGAPQCLRTPHRRSRVSRIHELEALCLSHDRRATPANSAGSQAADGSGRGGIGSGDGVVSAPGQADRVRPDANSVGTVGGVPDGARP